MAFKKRARGDRAPGDRSVIGPRSVLLDRPRRAVLVPILQTNKQTRNVICTLYEKKTSETDEIFQTKKHPVFY